MSNGVVPVCRPQVNWHSARPRHGSLPTTFGSDLSPTRLKRTPAIAGSAQPQLVMVRPSLERTTQLASTAPPSIGTQESAASPNVATRMR